MAVRKPPAYRIPAIGEDPGHHACKDGIEGHRDHREQERPQDADGDVQHFAIAENFEMRDEAERGVAPEIELAQPIADLSVSPPWIEEDALASLGAGAAQAVVVAGVGRSALPAPSAACWATRG